MIICASCCFNLEFYLAQVSRVNTWRCHDLVLFFIVKDSRLSLAHLSRDCNLKSQVLRNEEKGFQLLRRVAIVENTKRSGLCRDSVYSNIIPFALNVWEETTARQS